MADAWFLAASFAAAVAGGAVASVAGFGIGSILTPLVALRAGMATAVTLVSLPHFAATVLRAWRLRRHIDRTVLVRFGIASAAGGLAGAALHAILHGDALRTVFGVLLVVAGITGLTGVFDKLRLGRKTALAAGALSGGFGGLVGNQGGIRAVALLAFDIDKAAFVATSTAVGVMVDVARVPIYVATGSDALLARWPLVAAMTAGTLVGTLAGGALLRQVPQRAFKRVVSGLVLVLGVAVLVQALGLLAG